MRRRDSHHGGARRPADRRNRRLWPCAGRALGSSDASLDAAERLLKATRPTAHNLAWALRTHAPRAVTTCPAARDARRLIGGRPHLRGGCGALPLASDARSRDHSASSRPKATGPVQILTHCNAGWLACVDWGTALAPIYMAHDAGVAVHVWVDETRPRNQGALLTAYELAAHGVPHTVIADNVGGHLMQRDWWIWCWSGAIARPRPEMFATRSALI